MIIFLIKIEVVISRKKGFGAPAGEYSHDLGMVGARQTTVRF